MKHSPLPESVLESGLLLSASSYIESLYKERLSPKHLFHNYNRSKDIVQKTHKIAIQSSLSSEVLENVLLAAWFQDSGYTLAYQGYIRKSVQQAQVFLLQQNLSKDRIREISRLVLNTCTENKTEPIDLLEKILQDGKSSYLSEKKYFDLSELLRSERYFMLGESMEALEWEETRLNQLIQTPLYTNYARKSFKKGRTKNILKQQERLIVAKKELEKKQSGKNLGRGVDTMFRITLRNQVSMIGIADGKANMMISINTILLSLIITLIGSGITFGGQMLASNLEVVFPLLILMAGSTASVIFAILSASPKLSLAINRLKQSPARANRTFFGSFVHLSEEAFLEKLNEIKHNQQLLYDSLGEDLYQLGKILDWKFRLVKWSYRIFLIGLLASVVSFFSVFCFACVKLGLF